MVVGCRLHGGRARIKAPKLKAAPAEGLKPTEQDVFRIVFYGELFAFIKSFPEH